MILITGASGFLGTYLIDYLNFNDIPCVPVFRSKYMDGFDKGAIYINSIDSKTNWEGKLDNIDIIIHCAAVVHQKLDASKESLEKYREVNVKGTLNLALNAAKSGVKKFIYISSISVNGEQTMCNEKFTHNDKPRPETLYAISKAEAEKELFSLGLKNKMDITVIRSPLIYGPGVKSNFLFLQKLASRSFPMPFSKINIKKRSLVFIGNIASLIKECIFNDNASNKIFLVSDDEDLTLAELIQRLSIAQGQRGRSIPISTRVLAFLFMLIGKKIAFEKISSALELDIKYTCDTLNWRPPYTVHEGMFFSTKSDNSEHF
jgi:UDP-glucose 4-epimerase